MSKVVNTKTGSQDIMESKDDIKVSVICITYNHEKFLRECLDSMVCQKTNFPFEIVIHDDKSTDSTIDIIKEYKKKYPNLIVPIFEEENQYSKGKSIIEECAIPYAKGKYVAICEGDDRWCDENKLQKQYDFMESHPDYVACFHNSTIHDLSNKIPDRNFNNFKKTIDLSSSILFKNRYVHTSSYFVKKECYKKLDFGKTLWFGDFVILTSLFTYGKLAILPQVMSVYNNNNLSGVMKSKIEKSIKSQIDSTLIEIKYLEDYNLYFKGKYNREIKDRISYIYIYNIYDNKLLLSKDNKEFRQIKKELLKSDYYKNFMKQSNFKAKIKSFIKYHLPRKIFIRFRGK